MTTPTPWHWTKARTQRHLHDATNNSFAQVSMPLHKEYDEDAELIVTAVNNHARLMEENWAMREALEFIVMNAHIADIQFFVAVAKKALAGAP